MNLPFYDRNVVVNRLVYICTSYKMRGRAGMNGSVQKDPKNPKPRQKTLVVEY